jgi:hypothetical protein
MKVRTVDLEDAFDDLPFFGFHYEDLFYRGEYREELAKLGIYVPDLALDRRKPHNSINALVCVTGKYGSTYFWVTNNTGGVARNITFYYTYDSSTILGSYGTQYADNISIPRLENGESVLVPYQFQAGSTAGRIIGKAIKVTYTDPNDVSQTAYTTNPIFIMCNAQPKIRAYEARLQNFYPDGALDLRRFIPFMEIAPFNSLFEGMYISRLSGRDTSINADTINTWLSGSSSRWATIMHKSDSSYWYGYGDIYNTNLGNKLDPATELGAKPMALNEQVTTTQLNAGGTNQAPSTNYDLALQTLANTSYYSIVIKKATPWLALWYGLPDSGTFPNTYFKDYAFFAYLITVPLRRLGFYSTEYTA